MKEDAGGVSADNVFAHVADGIFILNSAGEVLDCNEQGAAMAGRSREELLGRPVSEFVPAEARPEQQRIMERLAAGQTVVTARTLHKKDGGTVEVEVSSRCAPDGRVIGIIRDMSKRKAAEVRLRRSEQLLRALIDSMPMLISYVDVNEHYRFNNQAYADWFKVSDPREFEGLTVREVVGEEAYEPIGPKLAMALAGEEVKCELALPYRKAGLRTVEAHYVPHFAESGEVAGLFAIVTDVSERRRMEEDLAKAEKLESVGVLAGGIAHDFNNLLTGILGNLNLARMKVEPEGDADDRLARAETGCLRARDLTSQLLTFARGGKPVKKTVGIAELLKESVELSARGSSMWCAYDVPADLWPVSADRGQLNQVFNNLAINAGQAMPDGGVLTVRAANVDRPDGTAPERPPGRYVIVTFRDSGHGIAPEDLARVFDPYFTTKEGGTGLGLTTSYSIVRAHGGFFEVESLPGQGAEFRVGIPAATGVTPPLRRIRKAPLKGSGKVLLMDDDKAVREAVAPTLAAMGYGVTCVSGGDEAVERYRKALAEGDGFDVVITDLTVRGGLGGLECLRQLTELDPDVVAVVSSGYSGNPVMADYAGYGFRGVLCKPYTSRELADALEKALGGE